MLSYNLHSYGWMITDQVRTNAYAEALRRVVKPGSLVLDIGTGVGIWALLACQFGARKVYAVEPNDVIEVAREIAAANGCADRIEFIQQMSTRIRLPERADVIVAEIHGSLPLFEMSLSSIIDARGRLLASGGMLIPQRENLWAAVAEAPESYRKQMTPWADNPYGLDLRAALRIVNNTRSTERIKGEQFLVEPQCWATLDYATVESVNVTGEVTWPITRAGTGHGISAWFDTTLAEGLTISNAPGAPEMIFGRAFFPWPEPVKLAIGDTVAVVLQANLVGEDYVWRWDTRVQDQGQAERVKARFKQSSFFGAAVCSARLHKLAGSHVPQLDEDGEIDRFILKLMNGENALGDIARQVSDRFPARFSQWRDALTRVGELSERYSRQPVIENYTQLAHQG